MQSNDRRRNTTPTVILREVKMGPVPDCPGIVALDLKGLDGGTTRYLASVKDLRRLGGQIQAEAIWLGCAGATGSVANDDARRRQRR